MKKAFGFLSGSVCADVSCEYPERFLNLCAGNNIEFRDIKKTAEGEMSVILSVKGYMELKLLEREGVFRILAVRKSGVPFILMRLKRRYALLVGLALCVGALFFSSMFIWEIDVSGNETVPSWMILENLKELGVGIGSCTLNYSQARVSNEMLLRVPELSWITVNIHGSRAEVLVREETPTPDVIDENEPALVYAVRSGLITDMTVGSGTAMCKTGDAVLKGEILISGAMKSELAGTRFVHAMGDVYARTRREFSAQTPLCVGGKEYTGRSRTKKAAILGGKRINLYFTGGNQWPCCDKITNEFFWTVFGDTVLPLGIANAEYSEYKVSFKNADSESAGEMLKSYLEEKLTGALEGGEILYKEFETQEKNGVVTVTVKAECIEQIAAVRPMTESELAAENTDYSNAEENG